VARHCAKVLKPQFVPPFPFWPVYNAHQGYWISACAGVAMALTNASVIALTNTAANKYFGTASLLQLVT
jgi:hypothetical protein